jgi:hypothetical protein
MIGQLRVFASRPNLNFKCAVADLTICPKIAQHSVAERTKPPPPATTHYTGWPTADRPSIFIADD